MASLIEIAGELVAAHAKSVKLSTEELLQEIHRVHKTLKELEAGGSPECAETGRGEDAQPSLPVREAFRKNEVVCLVCGQGGFETLTRHLGAAHRMKPGEYRKRFGIPRTQTLAAKAYSESRRKLAQERGLADNLAKAREVRQANIEARKKASAAKPKRGKRATE